MGYIFAADSMIVSVVSSANASFVH